MSPPANDENSSGVTPIKCGASPSASMTARCTPPVWTVRCSPGTSVGSVGSFRVFQLREPAAPADGAGASPSGDTVAYTACRTGDGTSELKALLQFLDVGTGRAGPLIDTGHQCYGWFSWRPDGRVTPRRAMTGSFRVWDRHTSELITERHVAPGHITGLDYTGDGLRLVVAEGSGATYAIDAETLERDGRPSSSGAGPTDLHQPGQPHRDPSHVGSFRPL